MNTLVALHEPIKTYPRWSNAGLNSKNVNLKCQKLKDFREYTHRSIIHEPQSQRILNHTPL